MTEAVLQLSVISVVCGAVMCLIPEGGCRNIAHILCTSVLIVSILKPVKDFDLDRYITDSTDLWQVEESFSEQAIETGDNLSRAVIEKKYSEYILDKARTLAIPELQADVQACLSDEGLWLPYSAEIWCTCTDTQQKTLCELIKTELGIPEERQQWNLG